MLYLMNWNDHFTSHQYVSVYWGQLANMLKKTYQFPEDKQEASVDEEGCNVSQIFNSMEVCFSERNNNCLNHISLMDLIL